MDYAVFQDCVKSMDLRQRFQKLQDEIYILNKNRELVPNLEWDQRYARAYAQLWQQIRQRIKVIQKRMLSEYHLPKLKDEQKYQWFMRQFLGLTTQEEEKICQMIYRKEHFRRIELEFFLWRETIDRLVGEYNVQKAEEGLEHESITNTCTDAGAKPGLF